MKNIAQAFVFNGEIVSVLPYGSGHINDTYCVICRENNRENHYILQKINVNVFKNPSYVVDNIIKVTDHLRKKAVNSGKCPETATLTPVKCHDGGFLYADNNGGFWRGYIKIQDSFSAEVISSPTQLYTSGRMFGEFQRDLADFDANVLFETIPDFHNTPVRLSQLKEAMANAPLGLVSACQSELDFIFHREKDCSFLTSLLACGKLPLRVTHNDTKLNNVLFDNATSEAICVIDLDTVMPGLIHYDFGDGLRWGASTACEDEADLTKVGLNLEYYMAYKQGFLSALTDILTPLERETLPMGFKIITLEQGIRFLCDHLSGDVYYKVAYPGHNLVRAKTQLKLVEEIENNWSKL